MFTFATPEPILVKVDLAVGDIDIIASDRTDTVVTVTPADPANNLSVEAARRVRIDRSPRALDIKQSMHWYRNYSRTLSSRLVTIAIELPSGSRVQGETAIGTFSSRGSLGECDLSVAHGDVRLDEIAGTLHVKVSSGDITVQRAHSDVKASTTTGSITIAEVISGTVELSTSVGAIEVGVREGSAANLDVRSKLGHVRNTLNAVDGPNNYANTIKLHARTDLNDIIVRRS
jgi:hypothetical protein